MTRAEPLLFKGNDCILADVVPAQRPQTHGSDVTASKSLNSMRMMGSMP